MRILILNQAFYPDVVSTAQHATDLALELAQLGGHILEGNAPRLSFLT